MEMAEELTQVPAELTRVVWVKKCFVLGAIYFVHVVESSSMVPVMKLRLFAQEEVLKQLLGDW